MADPNILDLTADGVQFAEWRTEVENDDLTLLSLTLGEGRSLTAVFEAQTLRSQVVFAFAETRAFRVLDEGGLLELWAASRVHPRPASTTFRVRGHQWQAESPL